MLVELGVVEQRYRAVSEVFDGASVTDVARRYGVARQTVHEWLRRYARNGGLGGLVDRSSRPESCPHQIGAVIEAQIVKLRHDHPGWGAATILWHLDKAGVLPLPSRSSIYRALVRHGLVVSKPRRRRREDYRRWERGRSMELWQMDVMGRAYLADGREVKLVTGIDDHSRFIVCARIVDRATARPVADALLGALRTHGAPEQLLTDNGNVFTDRFGRGVGPVMFDRICALHGIKHILTAPYSPTTTGKVERLHRTIRAEFLTMHDRKHPTISEFQTALDQWVVQYNTDRPHQSCGNQPPAHRFALADPTPVDTGELRDDPAPPSPPPISRWVNPQGRISLRGVSYPIGMTFCGELVQIVVRDGLVEVFHHGVLIATRAQRRKPPKPKPAAAKPVVAAVAPVTSTVSPGPNAGPTVTRLVDPKGEIGFAGKNYSCGKQWAGAHAQVTVVGDQVQFVVDGELVRIQPIRHDRAREYGAYARPNGQARKRTVKDDHDAHLPNPECRAGTGP
jgi:transposase InsO family protein